MMAKLPQDYVSRKAEILIRFKQVLEKHMDDFLAGRVEKMYEPGLHFLAMTIHCYQWMKPDNSNGLTGK